jgi:molybdopterin-containing oxidoreductase family iron-sulfur binding subunit
MPEQLVQLNVTRRNGAAGARRASLEVCPGKQHAHAGDPAGPVATDSPYWRSLQELARTPEFEAFLHREFPAAASEWADANPVSRRNFLKLMGASLALAGVNGGCERPVREKIVPYVQPPEQIQRQAKTLQFATAMPFGGYGKGLLVESYAGRPIKVEGNPEHPASLGATDPFAQASVLSLYDPDRSQTVLVGGEVSTWAVFVTRLRARLESKRAGGGAGLRILTGTVTSPTLVEQLRRLKQQFPQAKWHQYEPVNHDNANAAATQAFGRPLQAVYHFGRAQCIVSLDSNFLYDDAGSVRYARQFINGRRVRVAGTPASTPPGGAAGKLWRELAPENSNTAGNTSAAGPNDFLANRLYVAESTPTITGAMADHRLRLPPSQVEAVAYAIAAALKVSAAAAPPPPLPADVSRWVQAVADDLRQTAAQRRGATLVVAGPNQPPSVHVLAHAINDALGSVGVTVMYTDPVESWENPQQPTGSVASLKELADDMQRAPGEPAAVDTLIIIGGNPGYASPANLDFAKQLKDFSSREHIVEGSNRRELVNFTAHLSPYYDETSFNCQWHIPQSHYLEAWGDVRAFNGTASIVQPLISPLYPSHSAHEMLAALLGDQDLSPYEIVRRFWRAQRRGPGAAQDQPADTTAAPDPAFEVFWEKSLRDGVVEGTTFPAVQVSLRQGLQVPPPSSPGSGGLEVSFRPDPSVWDGTFANNGWLQELPKPLTKLTWDNAVYVSPRTAREVLGWTNPRHDEALLVNIRYEGRRLENVPAWVWPGHPDGSVTLHLGYGRARDRAGHVAALNHEDGGRGTTLPRGFDAYRLMTSGSPHFGAGLELESTGRTTSLACTQDHQTLEGRDIVRTHTVEQLRGAEGGPDLHPPDKSHNALERGHGEGEHVSLYPEYEYGKQHAWGMAIDMNACIGCNACVVACNAENNIAVVGYDQVMKGREMHWIRIDTYYKGDPEGDPEAVFQPMLCQHCEKAPCEVVCPVGATTHSHEGINEMTYNRCVGTRYCSNNCPYKVRRFNFFQFQDKRTPVLKLMRNPSVTVRDRGVMEKCTYCVQRVNATRIEAEKLIAQSSEAATPEERQQNDRRARSLVAGLQTACQQSCPTAAIVFGDLNHEDPRGGKLWVTRLKETPLNYGVLTELNTQPRTTYLPRLVNANPALGAPHTDPVGGGRHPANEARAT